MNGLSSRGTRNYRWIASLALVCAVVAAACGATTSAPAGSAVAPEPTLQEPAPQASPEVSPTTNPTAAPTSTQAPTPVPPSETPVADDALSETIVWDDCDGVECATLTVPVHYDDPTLGTIDIAVSVHRATGVAEERIGYLLVNPGGPGGSGIDFAQSAVDGAFTESILQSFDIVGFDPRGVGLSEPEFSCGDGTEFLALVDQIDGEVDTDEEIEIGEQIAGLCSDAMGPVGDLLHTANVARDMDQIRQALGATQISFYGGSYGSAVGVWYATLFPGSVRAMVIDGASNPLHDVGDTIDEQVEAIVERAGGFETQLAAAIGACADDTCPIFNDGNPTAYLALAAQKADLVSEASTTGSSLALLMGVITPLYSEASWAQLYSGLYELVDNDNPEPLAAIATLQLGETAGTSITSQVNCLDVWLLQPDEAKFEAVNLEEEAELEARLEVELPLIAQFVADEFEPCPFLGEHAPAPFDAAFDGGDVPILVIGNTSDPATPYVQSEELAQDVLSNGYLVRVEHANHVVYVGGFNECVNDYVEATLIDQTPPPDRVVDCDREEVEAPTLDDLDELVVTVCTEIAREIRPELDPVEVQAVCDEITDAVRVEFVAEDLLALFDGSSFDQELIEEFGGFIGLRLSEADVG